MWTAEGRDKQGRPVVVGLVKPRFSARVSTGLIDDVGAWLFCRVITMRTLAVALLLAELGLASAIAPSFNEYRWNASEKVLTPRG